MKDSADLTLMLVEDSQASMLFLQSELKKAGYHQFITAQDGEEAWEKLQLSSEQVDLMLLDRYMPKLDGYELLKRIKAHPSLHQLPVIMQTTASDEKRKRECLEAGAYYYLTKPFGTDTLQTVLSAAIRDLELANKMRSEIKHFQHSAQLLSESHFCVKTLQDASYVGSFLAHFFPQPERTAIGLTELLINGVEHGNLGISYLEKGELLYDGRWAEEIERRLALPENCDKSVDVCFKRLDDSVSVSIQDAGAGFEWQRYLKMDPARAAHPHGRGIAIAKTVSFDELCFEGSGNCVRASCKVQGQAQVVAA